MRGEAKKAKGKKNTTATMHTYKNAHTSGHVRGAKARGDIVTSMYTSNKNITYTQKKGQAEHVK